MNLLRTVVGLRRDDVCYLGDRKIPTVITYM